jgi:hypothetical protein
MQNDFFLIENEDFVEEPCISYSLFYHVNDVKKQLQLLTQNSTEESNYTIEQLIKIINPYEFIFTKLPNSKFSVSKLKPLSNLFYDLLEIIHTLNLFDFLEDKNINTMHFGKNSQSSIDCINMLRENYNDNHTLFLDKEETSTSILSYKNDITFLYFEMEMDETDTNQLNYTCWFVQTLIHILLLQKTEGIAIIKIGDIYYKPIIKILFLLCNFYEKMYLIKPNSSNIILSEKFIVCKKMLHYDDAFLSDIVYNLTKVLEQLQTTNTNTNKNNSSHSFHNIEIPIFFLNKLEEFNIITGQQQLNAYNQIINLVKMKNKEDKIENYKKINVQKCISWCEKYKIPSNKFNEKNNIFLPLIKIQKEEEDIIIDDDTLLCLPE